MNTNMISRCIRVIALIVAFLALLALLILTIRSTGFVTGIIGTSMDPTLYNGQIVLGMPVSINPMQEVYRGDIVTLNTHQSGKVIVKRIIALPGDTLEIRNNQIYLNGTVLQEDYIAEPMRTRDIPAFTLAEDKYFVLGDNRNISADSRMYGLFSRADMISVVQLQFNILPVLLFVAILSVFGTCLLFVLDQLDFEWAAAREQAHSQRHKQEMPPIGSPV